jgi:plasmid stabilization system protein ParE
MAEWTTAMVQDRLELAADVFRQLPSVKPQGYFNAWPEYFHTFGDKVAQEPRMRRPRPGPREISEAEEALLWLRWLEKDDARIVWLRANGRQWKPICWELGMSRATANRRWHYGIAVIVWRLNGKRVPANRSQEYLIAKAKG